MLAAGKKKNDLSNSRFLICVHPPLKIPGKKKGERTTIKKKKIRTPQKKKRRRFHVLRRTGELSQKKKMLNPQRRKETLSIV